MDVVVAGWSVFCSVMFSAAVVLPAVAKLSLSGLFDLLQDNTRSSFILNFLLFDCYQILALSFCHHHPTTIIFIHYCIRSNTILVVSVAAATEARGG